MVFYPGLLLLKFPIGSAKEKYIDYWDEIQDSPYLPFSLI
jgi:hypothetical protein